MSGYTDAAFRCMIAKYGKPDVMFTEFVPAEGLASPGCGNLLPILWKTEAERPIVAQIYGGDPRDFEQAAAVIAALGFDGIDINMGCPARMVEQRRGGSALIKDPARARAIIQAAQAGGRGIPVSVKTRIGYAMNEIETWLAVLLEAGLAAITIHARTRAEAYNTPANWAIIGRAAQLARQLAPEASSRPLIIGNGDVSSLADAEAKAHSSGCDGVMIGRSVYGNPWFFNSHVDRGQLPLRTVLGVMLEHIGTYLRLHGGQMPIEPLRKHIKAYASGFAGAAELRAQLLRATTFEELQRIVSDTVHSRAEALS